MGASKATRHYAHRLSNQAGKISMSQSGDHSRCFKMIKIEKSPLVE